MPGDSGRQGQRRARIMRSLLLLAAGLWLVLLLACLVSPAPAAAKGPFAPVFPVGTVADTPTNPPPAATATATATATQAVQPPTATVPAAPTDAPTATVDAGGGGGGDGGGGGGGGGDGGFTGAGAQPTRVVLSQPTVGSGDTGGLQGLSPAAFGSNGLLVATSLSCVTAILGLVIAFVALSVLVRTGYGPFLRALVLGKRAGRGQEGDVAQAFAGRGSRGRRTGRDDEGNGYNQDGYDGRGGGYGTAGAARVNPGPSGPRSGAQASSRPRPQQAPVSRGRANWQ